MQFKAKHLGKICTDILMIKMEKCEFYESLRETARLPFIEFL